jgi:pimeloyl-ACP methyl ester carboxylesterase
MTPGGRPTKKEIVMTTANVTEEKVQLAGTELYVPKGGSGSPVLVLHGFEGHEGWLAFHDALAENATVYAPAHPGYTPTERPEWLTSIAHQAIFYHWFIEQQGIGPVDVVGLGMGGWMAAHMAVTCPQNLRRLVLVSPAGIKPEHDEVFDIFITPWKQVIDMCFSDPASSPEYERIYGGEFQEFGGPREAGRTMSIRMGYRPFFYDPALPGVLPKVKLPTLIVRGDDDNIMPAECATLYQKAIAGSTLKVINQCGYWAQFERPQELAQLASEFFA